MFSPKYSMLPPGKTPSMVAYSGDTLSKTVKDTHTTQLFQFTTNCPHPPPKTTEPPPGGFLLWKAKDTTNDENSSEWINSLTPLKPRQFFDVYTFDFEIAVTEYLKTQKPDESGTYAPFDMCLYRIDHGNLKKGFLHGWHTLFNNRQEFDACVDETDTQLVIPNTNCHYAHIFPLGKLIMYDQLYIARIHGKTQQPEPMLTVRINAEKTRQNQ